MKVNWNSLNLPNFTTILLRLETTLDQDDVFIQRFTKQQEKAKLENFYIPTKPELDFTMFSQVWGSTCLGFDIDENHEAMCGRQAMTKAYTTIAHEITTDIYFVFFDNELCYTVYNPTKKFFKDKNSSHMSPLSTAKVLYERDIDNF